MTPICIIAKNKETYFIKRALEEASGKIQLFDPWSDFELPEANRYLVRTTGVYGSDLDQLIIQTLPLDKVINSYEVLKTFRSKDSQYNWFEENDFPILPWISLKGLDLLNVEKFFRLYPNAIVKPTCGQGGWGVEKLNWDTFKAWKKKHDDNYLLQPFIQGAVEYRYFFMDGNDAIVLEREVRSGVASNFKSGGKAKISKIPDKCKTSIEKLVLKSKAKYGAIDFLVYDDTMTILELNTVPGFEQLELVSGLNVVKKIIQSLS